MAGAESNRSTSNRKEEHVELTVRGNVSHRNKTSGFENLEFEHNALPELAFEELSTQTTLLGHSLGAPLIISSMTGGYAGAEAINAALARVTGRHGLAMGLGSMRQAMESDTHHASFRSARREAPTALLFANIGAVEVARLHATGEIATLQRLVDLIEANAIAVHLNPLQELLQPEGSVDFRGVLNGIETLVKNVQVPIIVKEVGSGISRSVAERLLNVGVHAIDVAGAGGTSWAGVEILRNPEAERSALDPFWDWGIPTVDALTDVAELREAHTFDLIASGGITNGLDIAKAIALGATACGIARPLITALVEHGESALERAVEHILFQLRAAMFLTGSRDISSLRDRPLYVKHGVNPSPLV